MQTTCGPTLEETHHTEYVNRRLFMFTCPSGAGSLNDFHYSWYSERVSDSRLIKNGSRILEQQLRAEELPLIFLCQIKNVHTGKNVRFTLKVVERVSTEQRSLLWVVIPALLIIILVPLTYLAYLKFIGEFDIGCNCQNAILEDDVDYMITQIAESSNPQEDKKSPVTKARRSKLALFRRTLRQVSNAVNKISSNISLTATVQASLPITDDQTKIKASKKMRLKRAEFLKQLNWPTLFKRPTRKIKKQSEKDYEDDETHWVACGLRKVDRWQKKIATEVTTSHSAGSIENLFIQDDGLAQWAVRLAERKGKLNRSDVPCKRDTWLDLHRNSVPDKIEQFKEQDLMELSEKLNEMFRIIKPDEKYFPTTKKIREPFESVLDNTDHELHNIIQTMWDNYVEQLFIVSYCVSSFHKLCKKVLERTLTKYGNPEKAAKKTSDDKIDEKEKEKGDGDKAEEDDNAKQGDKDSKDNKADKDKDKMAEKDDKDNKDKNKGWAEK